MKKLYLLILLLPLLGQSCNNEPKIIEIEKPVIVEKIVDKKTLIEEQKTISLPPKHISHTDGEFYVVSANGKIFAVHTSSSYAQLHRQHLINDGKNAIIYKTRGSFANFK